MDWRGRRVEHPLFTTPKHAVLADLHRTMLIGRRFNQQASTLARQGRLTGYPSSTGQEATQVGGVLALSEQDWLFPSYRDSVALITRGVDPVETLTLFRGNWHVGYDPHRHRCAPQCTPLATNASHAVSLTYAARRKGRDVAALVLMGDGATSVGDSHEAYNFAAAWNTPVVFLVQDNHWAVSVLPHQRTADPPLAHQALGYGVKGYRVDGDDAAAVYSVASHALSEARAGGGPAIVEAVTCRRDPRTGFHTPQRYRNEYRVERDPLVRVEALLRAEGAFGSAEEADRALAAFDADAEKIAAAVREGMAGDDGPTPLSLFTNARSTPPPLLHRQRHEWADGARKA